MTDSFKKDANTETALDILKKRYARGEITKEEFKDKEKDIVRGGRQRIINMR